MTLDTTTLTVAGGFVALMASLLLASAWTQIPRAPALGWWAAASLLDAAGIFGITFATVNHSPTMLSPAVALIIVSPAVGWAGIRRFCGRPISVPLVVAGLAAWLAFDVVLAPTFPELSAAAAFVPSIAYLVASAYELWRDRREPLRGRYGLVGVFMLHAVVLAGGVFDTFVGTLSVVALPTPGSWFGLIDFESLFYSMASAVFMVLLTKERSERRHIVAAREDPLTGIANRRALLEGGERLLQRCQTEGRSFSIVMFDLDRFKWVNDTFGHAAGDSVIRAFAMTTKAVLRPNDLFGRYGGEEFVVILPGATIEAAFVIAERIRNGFAGLEGNEFRSTVSAGVASATSDVLTLEEIMKIADAGLYRAKESGRNRVERPLRRPDAAPVDVIRIA